MTSPFPVVRGTSLAVMTWMLVGLPGLWILGGCGVDQSPEPGGAAAPASSAGGQAGTAPAPAGQDAPGRRLAIDALTPEQQAQFERANAARQAMFMNLMSALTRAMSEGGPVAAIEICQDRAPQIAREVSQARALRIGRTSHRLRNPDNAPPAWTEPFVQARLHEPAVIELADAGEGEPRLGVMFPILTGETCLTCHGPEADLDPAVIQALGEHYPDDLATGFEAGELRGWFWIETPVPAPADGEPS